MGKPVYDSHDTIQTITHTFKCRIGQKIKL